jgi:hypothetical protein
MRKATTGVAKLDRVWHATSAVFQHLATLAPDERQHVVTAINEHWQALPVIAAVGGGTADAPLFPEAGDVPQLPPLKGARAAE